MLITRYHTDVHDGGDRAFELVKDPGPRAIDPPLLIPSSLCFFLLSLELAHCAFTELLISPREKLTCHCPCPLFAAQQASSPVVVRKVVDRLDRPWTPTISRRRRLCWCRPRTERSSSLRVGAIRGWLSRMSACGCSARFAVTFGILNAYRIFGPQTSCDQCFASKGCYVRADGCGRRRGQSPHTRAAVVQRAPGRRRSAGAHEPPHPGPRLRLRGARGHHAPPTTASWSGSSGSSSWPPTQEYINLPVIATILLILLILGVDLLGFRRLVRGWEEEQ
ncbi:hypothetical protein EJB05_46681, partial [Eragrostis curvula]